MGEILTHTVRIYKLSTIRLKSNVFFADSYEDDVASLVDSMGKTLLSIHWLDESDDNSSIASSSDDDEEEEVDGVDTEEEEESEEMHPELDDDSDAIFVIPLRNKFEKSNLSFMALTETDFLISQMFQSISFIDVHLAIVVQCIDPDKNHPPSQVDDENRKLWIKKWIEGKRSIPQFREVGLDMPNQLIGKFHSIVTNERNCYRESRKGHSAFYHAALIIQPRQRSVYYGCLCNFDNVLNHLAWLADSTIEESPCFQKSSREHLISTLGQILAFCRQEPYHVWGDPTVDFGVRARRLMELCTRLEAKEESLDLLDIIGAVFKLRPGQKKITFDWDDDESDEFYEGVRDAKVAQAIANLQSQVTGNNII